MNYIDTVAWLIHDMDSDTDPSDDDWPLYRIYAVLCLAKGTETTAKDVHDAWSAWQAAIFPEHRSIVPFDELPEHVQRYDDEYVVAIHKVAIHLRGAP
jgi:hypothetical protein